MSIVIFRSQNCVFACKLPFSFVGYSMLMATRSTLTDWIWDAPLQWLYWRSQIPVFTEKSLPLHICKRCAESYFILLWDFVSKATSWPSSYIQVKSYDWYFWREQAYGSSVLCVLFYMVIMPLLLMDPATWFRATPIVRFVNSIYLMTRWEWWYSFCSRVSIVFCSEN